MFSLWCVLSLQVAEAEPIDFTAVESSLKSGVKRAPDHDGDDDDADGLPNAAKCSKHQHD